MGKPEEPLATAVRFRTPTGEADEKRQSRSTYIHDYLDRHLISR